MKQNGVAPVELSRYAIANGYCYGGTSRSFFSEVTREGKYSLNTKRLPGSEIQTVKRLLSDGKHMAIAIMKSGHFTKGGHYIVLSGVDTMGGVNYFNVLDPHRDNTNYGTDGSIIDDIKNDGRVKARAGIFLNEADEYWVYSTGGENEVTDQRIEGKLNLEKLGYTGLRNANWELSSDLDSKFNEVRDRFLLDYGLTASYNSMQGNKETQLFIWIKQAINGQRTRVISNEVDKGDNNTNTEVINVGSVTSNFLLGVLDAVKGTAEGIWQMISHPIDSIKGMAEAAYQLARISKGYIDDENAMIIKQIITAVSEMISEFENGDLNVKARMIGRLVGEIILAVVGDKGFKFAMKGLGTVSKSSKFLGALKQGNGASALRLVDGAAGAILKIRTAIKTSTEGLNNFLTKVYDMLK